MTARGARTSGASSRDEPFAHAAIVLAAGASRRLGTPKQLVVDGDGETLLHRASRLASATRPRETIVVLGHDAEAMHAAIADLPIRRVDCVDWRDGMGASLRAGVGAVDASVTHALVVLCDQLALDAAHLDALVATARARPTHVVASAYDGVVGVPAVFPRAWFARLLAVRGDVGARALLRADDVEVIAIRNEALRFDLDEPPAT